VSTQWGPQGYFYPTQIAQYALSHYSKFLKVGDVGEPLVIEDAEDDLTTRWTSKGSARLRIVVDQETLSHVLEFRASSKLVFGTDNLNSTDVPLSNKQADKLVPLLCDSVEEEELKHE